MPHVERIGTSADIAAEFDTLLADHTPVIAEIARTLRAILIEAFPEAVEQVDFSNRLLGVGRTMKVRDLTFAVAPYSVHVNLQLADGVELPDPEGIVEGTGKRIRHVKVRSTEFARSPVLRAIVDAQVALRR